LCRRAARKSKIDKYLTASNTVLSLREVPAQHRSFGRIDSSPSAAAAFVTEVTVDRTGSWEVIDPLVERIVPESAHPSVSLFLRYLRESGVVSPQELERFLLDNPAFEETDTARLGDSLVHQGLLNSYQLKRVCAGQTFALVLGNYRILDWLGAGGMGIVYKAEHVHMKRPVALKVLITEEDDNAVFLQRFSSEMQALAVLRHPNIVLAFDAGEVRVPNSGNKMLRYLVMEYVPGENLEQYVLSRGPLPIALACDFVRQAANGLRHAHEHGLVHRDIKPSNLLVMGLAGPGPHTVGQGQIKILDFGLARLCRRRCTAAYSVLGTVDYMAPEQARDARSVDVRADIYALGGTLYWLLTGQRPFPSDRPPVEELLARQFEAPVPPRSHRPDIPLELEAVVCQMMARDPNDRYPTPLAVISALDTFLDQISFSIPVRLGPPSALCETPRTSPGNPTVSRAISHSDVPTPREHIILVASPDAALRQACRTALDRYCVRVSDAGSEEEALRSAGELPADIVIVDGEHFPEGGLELCQGLREEALEPYLKLLLLSSTQAPAPEAEVAGDDRLSPAGLDHLGQRIQLLLRLREIEERADRAAAALHPLNTQLEQALQQRDLATQQAQDVLLFAMAKVAELGSHETGAHLRRMQQYIRVLAEEAMRLPAFSALIDDAFVRRIERCVLLHDIGKVAVPDHVLLKPAKLDAEERVIMESHTLAGASFLEAVGKQHGAALDFLPMATDIVRSHHERYDGAGYPDGLLGDSIPLAARIVAVADVYDAMRSTLVYKPGLSHAAVRRLIQSSQGQFDPGLLVAFGNCEGNFKLIFDQTAG
jgi:response regulator RpfG family c-di-GMP phosphodiesterase/serine/threonine protein kinase